MNPLSDEELLRRVLFDGDEQAAHALLNAFFDGLPVERLREVLRSEDEHTLRAGAWIASELGTKAAPLVPDLARLLGNPSRYVRFFSIDAILGSATLNAPAIARAATLLEDPDPAVRWKATNFLARASIRQLSAGLLELAGGVRPVVEELVRLEGTGDESTVTDLLGDADARRRLIGLIGAFRLSKGSTELLLRASESKDPELREIANEWIASISTTAH